MFSVLVPKMLDECMEYLEGRSREDPLFLYEVIVVSDGSKDRTVEVALEYAKKYTSNKLRVLALVTNRGKGGAVRLVHQKIVFICYFIIFIFLSTIAGDAKCSRRSIALCRC